MRTPDSELRQYYAARAAEYDDDGQYPPERAADLEFIREWFPTLLAGKRVLDVACGTGAWAERIARTAASVVGIDIEPNMLDIARRRTGTGRIRFELADAYSLGRELGMFDAAFLGFWLSHVPRKRISTFLASLHQRLEPRAKVVIVDNTEAFCRTTPISERDADGNTFQARTLADGSSHRVLKNFPTEMELVAATAPFSVNPFYRALEHFWVFTCEASGPERRREA